MATTRSGTNRAPRKSRATAGLVGLRGAQGPATGSVGQRNKSTDVCGAGAAGGTTSQGVGVQATTQVPKSVVLGIDPGANTGVALFEGGGLVGLATIAPVEITRLIMERAPQLVVFEDSRLQTHAWNARGKSAYGAALATARSLGQVDAWCSLIESICTELKIKAIGVSPRSKGAKLNAEQFLRATGWAAVTNEHSRDAAMVAWPYRRAAQ